MNSYNISGSHFLFNNLLKFNADVTVNKNGRLFGKNNYESSNCSENLMGRFIADGIKDPSIYFITSSGSTSCLVFARRFIHSMQIDSNVVPVYSGIYKGRFFASLPSKILDKIEEKDFRIDDSVVRMLRQYQNGAEELLLGVKRN